MVWVSGSIGDGVSCQKYGGMVYLSEIMDDGMSFRKYRRWNKFLRV
jgi:hypothetical protein